MHIIKLNKWKAVPRCTQADASVQIYIMQEETRTDEEEGPTAVRMDVWVSVFVLDEPLSEKLYARRLKGYMPSTEQFEKDQKELEILTVMGHANKTYTVEQIAAGNDTLQVVRDAVGQALYGAAMTVKERREGSAIKNKP